MIGQSVWMIPTRSSPGMSAAVNTATTPGAFRADSISIRWISARAWSVRRRAAWSIPGTRMSST